MLLVKLIPLRNVKTKETAAGLLVGRHLLNEITHGSIVVSSGPRAKLAYDRPTSAGLIGFAFVCLHSLESSVRRKRPELSLHQLLRACNDLVDQAIRESAAQRGVVIELSFKDRTVLYDGKLVNCRSAVEYLRRNCDCSVFGNRIMLLLGDTLEEATTALRGDWQFLEPVCVGRD